jgi:3-phenylpropionate/cinnamic acid dioxygenase small subunit
MQVRMSDTASNTARHSLHRDIPSTFLPIGAPVYSEIQQFVNYEAFLLDHQCFEPWQRLLAQDFTYSVHNVGAAGGSSPENVLRVGNRQLILENLVRLQHVSASARMQNTPQIRRLILNVSVSFAHRRNEFIVVSYVRIVGAASEDRAPFDWNAERWDHLRGTDRSFKIARREILLDESAIEPPGIVEFP